MRISDWSSDVCSSDLLTGPGGPNLYFKGLIEKLAINVEVFRVGAFKSAVEPFTRSDQSPEAEAAAQALVNTIWSVWKGDVARARPRAKIESYIDALPQQVAAAGGDLRSEEHTSELQSLMRISYAVFCLKKTKKP